MGRKSSRLFQHVRGMHRVPCEKCRIARGKFSIEPDPAAAFLIVAIGRSGPDFADP